MSRCRLLLAVAVAVVACLCCLQSLPQCAALPPGTELFNWYGGVYAANSVAVDAADNIYIGDVSANAILVLAGTHSTSPAPGTIIGSYGADFLGLPGNEVIDPEGRIFVASVTINAVQVLAGLTSATPGALLYTLSNLTVLGCNAVALDKFGTVYVVDQGYGTVVVAAGIGSTNPKPGTVLAQYLDSTQAINQPYGLTVDADGTLIYVADTGNNRIAVLAGPNSQSAAPGTELFSFTANSTLQAPESVILDPQGNMLVADAGSGRIAVLAALNSSTPGLLLYAYTDRTLPLYYPLGVALDSQGNLVVADPGNNRVVVLTPEDAAEPDTELGSFSSDTIGFSQPYSLVTDSAGRLYVDDFPNSRILVWAGLASLNPPAGSLLFVFTDNNTISGPRGLTLDSNEDIWVTDTSAMQRKDSAPARHSAPSLSLGLLCVCSCCCTAATSASSCWPVSLPPLRRPALSCTHSRCPTTRALLCLTHEATSTCRSRPPALSLCSLAWAPPPLAPFSPASLTSLRLSPPTACAG